MSLQVLKTPLQAGRYYHLYNRGNNKEKLFYFNGNYQFFMKKYFIYMNSVVDTYCYCLLPNHFHFLIKIRDEETNPQKVSNQFRKLFISYARHINFQEKRVGCLLSKNFKRIEIKDEDYLKRIVLYIHFNPVKHGVHIDALSYYYSTLYQMKNNRMLTKEFLEIFEWFGGYEDFLESHRIVKDDKMIKKYKLE
jgi:REP element-mobilizing transposase RayT